MAAAPPPPGATPSDQQRKKRSRRNLIIAAVVVIVVIILIAAFWPSASPGSSPGQFKLSGIDVQWNGTTYTLLDTPYSSSTSSGGYGNDGFTLDAEFASGTCPTSASCFNPGASFSLESVTPGFQVSWVTACYQSKGYGALVGPIYYRYSATPSSIPSGCASAGTDVDMAGVGLGTLVYLTVSVQFISGSSYSGALTLKATPLSSNQSISETVEDTTSTTVVCTPGTIPVESVTQCAVIVEDVSSAPKATAAPTGHVNFTADSGSFGSGSGSGDVQSCDSAPSQSEPNSSATCTVNYLSATLGSAMIFAGYSGDGLHDSSSGVFEVQTFQYTLSVSPTNQSVAQGSAATYTVTATLFPGSATTDLPNVTLSVQFCTEGIATCSFSPTEITPSSAGNATTLTITPVSGAVQVPYSNDFNVVGSTGTGDYVFMVTSNNAAITVTA